MDIDVERNAYGRQIDSRVVEIEPEPDLQRRTAPANWKPCSSARPSSAAPGPDAKVLARYNGDPVLVEKGSTWWPRFIRN